MATHEKAILSEIHGHGDRDADHVISLVDEIPPQSLVFPWFPHRLEDIFRAKPDGSPSPSYSPKAVYRVAAAMFRALRALHRRDVVHADINGVNILISNDQEIKLGDLGAAYHSGGTTLPANEGSSQYESPELAVARYNGGDARPTEASDVWAMGCVIY